MVNDWPIIERLLGARCILCGAPGNGLCDRCNDDLPTSGHACARCATPLPAGSPSGLPCAPCQARPPPQDATIAALRYAPPVDDLVAGLKYHGRLALGAVLATRLAGAVLATRTGDNPDWPELLVPVPLANDRLRERGFNQAGELARVVARRLQIPLCLDLLERPVSSSPQRGLARLARQGNVRGAFEARGRAPRRVAVIDDVVTTGATAAQAALALRRAGADRVEVWAVARTPPRGGSGEG